MKTINQIAERLTFVSSIAAGAWATGCDCWELGLFAVCCETESQEK